ncbi:NUDIX hydrolase [Paenibacillus radicis (ex Gao et al. 2016)]|uniref:DNA mismatch repair protein MutT n=1 Tax=Paenibacillus radicis (ex Gao et al. 2016) TaxID=1737354 RepID=A0A917H9K8_9BACL|nr:NUDIX domain-containing protein [Paenibacillus radicis (ex Gao et al. 2016)]GGG71208.1 DNA mismatch repair protein MutT [Paenibacillus radicis (ex Gao et al. 2016)]
MGYIEELRALVGNQPLILVRPSAAVVNKEGKILLVQHNDHTWGIPGGLMELGESTEECLRRELKEELQITLKHLRLVGVYSGEALYTRLKNGHEYYNVVIAYLCTEYEGELRPDGIEILDAAFYSLNQLPEQLNPFIREKLQQLGPALLKQK